MKKAIIVLCVLVSVFILCACDSDSSSYSSGSSYSSRQETQSFSDYLKENDPDLYNSITDRYESIKP